MDHRLNPDADGVTQARALLSAAAKGVERLETTASHAFCRLSALKGLLTRLEDLSESREPDAAEAAALYAATVCRETKALLHFIDSHSNGLPTPPFRPPHRRMPRAAPDGTAMGMR
jgi:hypothetical protein